MIYVCMGYGMPRILIDLSEETIKELEELASKRGISRAEIIRQATDALIKAERSKTSSIALKTAFGLWKKDPLGDEELQALRAEWGP